MKRSLLAFTSRLFDGSRSTLLLLSALTLTGLSLSAPLHAEEVTRDGLYLRGSHPVANQIGESYMVFSVQNGQTVGGFYQPQSSFDCFYGSIGSDYMPLTVVNSYTEDRYTYAMNLSRETIVANASQTSIASQDPVSAYAIAELDETARRVLATCQSQLSDDMSI
ncbi:MAG: hypothetical protein HC795_03815 [Coleofasciculaceae cyanobacterium RL_1_1]|nr:hypothetical protein [Coleofasciculaceae cyanobacterium RL_1_1]